MREMLAGGAGLLITSGLLLTVAGGAGRWRGSSQPRGPLSRLLTLEAETALATGWGWLTPQRSVLIQLSVALACALIAVGLTGLVALAAAGLVSGLAIARGVLRIRIGSLRRRRQDQVLEAVRTLRQVLEAGGAGVQQGLQALATRGPVGLRAEFGAIAAGAAVGRQGEAWAKSRRRLQEPLFDLLSTAIEVQRPSGGRLGPLFVELEESVTALHEVAREAEALQVQARSAALLIVCLPVVFLVVLSALRSPYLDAYRAPAGEVFLTTMLAVMAVAYGWIMRWLRLPADDRLKLRDA